MKRWLPVIAAGLIGLGCLGLAGWRAAEGWTPSRARYPFQGMDVRGGEGPFEWRQLRAAGASFVYHVATEGTARDPGFEGDWDAIAEAGLGRGAVHVYSFCAPAATQAAAFLALVPRSADALPPALVIEFAPDCAARPDRATLLAELRALLDAIEAHSGHPALLRVSPEVERFYQLTAALPRPIWTSAQFFAPGLAPRPWRLWRASGFHRIEGAPAPVHWDVIAP
ncbi:MAG: hypothetical protein A4S12_05030 [Proteobacteria bacterium SG_bin5]|nr:glycosyl hydrolase [Sphingomonas sp.]OQW43376.1 MAG: hypothetical protein A4S12_05030 [Proteobacteria bacterium SG_bin5]